MEEQKDLTQEMQVSLPAQHLWPILAQLFK